jgi:hypothetical protein
LRRSAAGAAPFLLLLQQLLSHVGNLKWERLKEKKNAKINQSLINKKTYFATHKIKIF